MSCLHRCVIFSIICLISSHSPAFNWCFEYIWWWAYILWPKLVWWTMKKINTRRLNSYKVLPNNETKKLDTCTFKISNWPEHPGHFWSFHELVWNAFKKCLQNFNVTCHKVDSRILKRSIKVSNFFSVSKRMRQVFALMT